MNTFSVSGHRTNMELVTHWTVNQKKQEIFPVSISKDDWQTELCSHLMATYCSTVLLVITPNDANVFLLLFPFISAPWAV